MKKESKNGLSRSTHLQGDIAKKEAVKIGGRKAIGDNLRVTAKGMGLSENPGGHLSPKKLAGVGKDKK